MLQKGDVCNNKTSYLLLHLYQLPTILSLYVQRIDNQL